MKKRILSAVLLTFLAVSMLLPTSAGARIEWENNANSLVASDITSGSTSVTVTTGQGNRFPAVTAPHYFMMTLIDVSGNREIVKVTARSAGSNTMTIVRAQESTSAQVFAAGSLVDQRITKHSLDNFSQTYEQFVNYYVCDASAVDQADTVNSNSLASLAATIGTSLNATIVLPHTGTGSTTAYNVLQNLDLSTYGNITFIVNRGAVITHGANTVDMPVPQAGIYQITDQATLFSGAGAVTFNAIPDIASAAALPVLFPGHADVTGTTTVTSFNSIGIGSVVKLHFDGALILTHHATDLILPGGNNITTYAGLELTFVEYATGDVRLVGGVNTKPTIDDLTNAQHDHSDAANGGDLGDFTGAQAQVTDMTFTGSAASPPDANTIVKDNIVKAWINFDMTVAAGSSIRDSFNVSSVVDNSAGAWTINWDTDFANTSYACVASVRNDAGSNDIINIQTTIVGSSNIEVDDNNGAAVDASVVMVIAIGDQ